MSTFQPTSNKKARKKVLEIQAEIQKIIYPHINKPEHDHLMVTEVKNIENERDWYSDKIRRTKRLQSLTSQLSNVWDELQDDNLRAIDG